MPIISKRKLATSETTEEDHPQPLSPLPILSEYEQLRYDKIVVNNAKLVALGLLSKNEERISNLKASGATVTPTTPSATKKNKPSSKPLPQEGKKSLRLQGLDPNGELALLTSLSGEEIHVERAARIIECREARLRAANALAKSGIKLTDIMEKQCTTATHEHCMMRIRTMSEKALNTRINRIEKAAGKFCIVKMAVFKSCLQEANMCDLAEHASESLARLCATSEE